jgi:hypothetical protein
MRSSLGREAHTGGAETFGEFSDGPSTHLCLWLIRVAAKHLNACPRAFEPSAKGSSGSGHWLVS